MLLYSLFYFFDNFSLKPIAWVACGVSLQKENAIVQSRPATYLAFHKHANSKVQKPPSQLRFSLPSIIITITSNET